MREPNGDANPDLAHQTSRVESGQEKRTNRKKIDKIRKRVE